MIAYITEQQANELRGQEWTQGNQFLSLQDENGRWFISEQEVKYCDNPAFAWVNDLELQQMPVSLVGMEGEILVTDGGN
jgi:hypothetical protein